MHRALLLRKSLPLCDLLFITRSCSISCVMSFCHVRYGLRTTARNTIPLMLSINKYIYLFHSITITIAQLMCVVYCTVHAVPIYGSCGSTSYYIVYRLTHTARCGWMKRFSTGRCVCVEVHIHREQWANNDLKSGIVSRKNRIVRSVAAQMHRRRWRFFRQLPN